MLKSNGQVAVSNKDWCGARAGFGNELFTGAGAGDSSGASFANDGNWGGGLAATIVQSAGQSVLGLR